MYFVQLIRHHFVCGSFRCPNSCTTAFASLERWLFPRSQRWVPSPFRILAQRILQQSKSSLHTRLCFESNVQSMSSTNSRSACVSVLLFECGWSSKLLWKIHTFGVATLVCSSISGLEPNRNSSLDHDFFLCSLQPLGMLSIIQTT